MDDVLENVIQHKPGFTRVIFEMPPRHGKSERVSRRLPAAYLGRHPDRHVIHGTYNSDLAKKEGRKVQGIMVGRPFKQLHPGVRLPAETKRSMAGARYVRTKEYFEIVGHEGTYNAAGIGGTFTGTGMDLGIVDDPIKNAKEADSETVREAHWEWWLSTFLSRDEGNAAIVGSMTRWHEDDLVGRILENAKESGEKWLVIRFEATREDMTDPQDPRDHGEALWPAKFSKDWLEARKRTYGKSRARWWNSLYQQNPTQSEGAIFQRAYWGYYDPTDALDPIATAHSWDTAHGKKKTNDFSVRGKFSVFRRDDGKICARLVDVFRQKLEFPALKRQAESDLKADDPTYALVEAKASGKDLIPALVEVFGEKRIVGVEPQADKVQRADNQIDLVEDQRLLLPSNNPPWLKIYIDELANFPTGKHDDQVDMTTQFLKWMRETFKDEAPVSALISNPRNRDRRRGSRF